MSVGVGILFGFFIGIFFSALVVAYFLSKAGK